MEDQAKSLVTAAFAVVQRDWSMLTNHWQRMLQIDLAEDSESQIQFAIAALAVGLGQKAPVNFRDAVEKNLLHIAGASSDLGADLRKYAKAWCSWQHLSGKFLVPPLEHQHEAIGIAFADSVNLKATITHNGKEYYNLVTVGILGMCIANTVIEVNKLMGYA